MVPPPFGTLLKGGDAPTIPYQILPDPTLSDPIRKTATLRILHLLHILLINMAVSRLFAAWDTPVSLILPRHPEGEIGCSIHGDDLSAAGPKEALDWYDEELQTYYELGEGARLGPGPEDSKEANMLNRVIRWTPYGL